MTLSEKAKAIKVMLDAIDFEDREAHAAAEAVLHHMRKRDTLKLLLRKLVGELK